MACLLGYFPNPKEDSDLQIRSKDNLPLHVHSFMLRLIAPHINFSSKDNNVLPFDIATLVKCFDVFYHVEPVSPQNACEVASFCDYYEIATFLPQCNATMVDMLQGGHASHVLRILKYATVCENKELKIQCLDKLALVSFKLESRHWDFSGFENNIFDQMTESLLIPPSPNFSTLICSPHPKALENCQIDFKKLEFDSDIMVDLICRLQHELWKHKTLIKLMY